LHLFVIIDTFSPLLCKFCCNYIFTTRSGQV